MSRYVQTFSQRDQSILNHAVFMPSAPKFTKVDAETLINALWLNTGCTHWLFPDPNQNPPRIRRSDVRAFMDIWIRCTVQNANFGGRLRGHFTADRWVQYRGGYAAFIVAYRTFQLWVHSETPDHSFQFSILDVSQVLTSCSQRFQGDEMPSCTGEWTRGDERVQWHVQATPRPELRGMIKSTRDAIHEATRKEHVYQCDVLIALCGFYETPEVIDEKLPTDKQLELKQQNQQRLADNASLDGLFRFLGLSEQTARCLPRRGTPVDKFTQHSKEQLVAMYQASRTRLLELNCECCQMLELSVMLGE